MAVETNVPVVAESTIESRANSAVTFDDVEAVTEASKKAEKKEAKAEKKASVAKPAEAKEDGRAKEKKPAKESDASSDEAEAPEKKEAKDGKEEADKPVEKAKAKTHKVRSGDSALDVSGDSLISVVIDGKKEDVSFQDLVNNYSGKVAYDRKFTDLDKEKKSFEAQVKDLDSMVSNVFAKSKESPDDALDILAELAGQDSVKIKEEMLRAQVAQMLPLAQMDEAEREAWIKDRVRDWRDKKFEGREKAEKAKAEEAAKAQALAKARESHGIDEEAWTKAESLAKQYLKGETPTTEQVIYADSMMHAISAVREHVPHLETSEKFDTIVEDIALDLMRHPALRGGKLAEILKATFAEDDSKPLKALSKKVAQSDEAFGSGAPRVEPKRSKSEAVTFADLD